MTKTPSKADFIKRIQACYDRIAKARDELREIHEEVESVITSSSEGLDRLDDAINTLSEYL